MKSEESAALRRVRVALERYGLLLLADARLPSLATIVAGEPVRGSWWGHPAAHSIVCVARELAGDTVIDIKLVSSKVTFVHRKLWPALVAVGCAREPWQLEGLSAAARALLSRVERAGRLRTDELPGYRGGKSKAIGEAARELEQRLLVRGEEFHTETGAHAKWLETWNPWVRRVGLGAKRLTLAAAKQELEAAVQALCAGSGVQAELPWKISPRPTANAKRQRHGS